MTAFCKENTLSPEQFCYWLQGALELGDLKELDPQELKIVKDHLSLVFQKLTPSYGQSISIPNVQMTPALNPYPFGQGQGSYIVRNPANTNDLNNLPLSSETISIC